MMFGTPLAQMRPGSAFLAGLNAGAERAAGVPVVSLWSWHDSMVTPQTSSRLPWAENIVIAGVAHNALLNDRGVWDRGSGGDPQGADAEHAKCRRAARVDGPLEVFPRARRRFAGRFSPHAHPHPNPLPPEAGEGAVIRAAGADWAPA